MMAGGTSAEGKLIHTFQGHILEKLDEDIQTVNAIKSKLLNEATDPTAKSAPSPAPLSSFESPLSNENKGASLLEDGPLDSLKNEVALDSKNPLKDSNNNRQVMLEDSSSPNERNWDANDTISNNVDKSSFRNYIIACDRVKAFYKEQHHKQTFAYNIQARINFKTKVRARLTIWDALVKLNNLIDKSDPDTELSQIDHAIQTAEAIRRDRKPRWMQLVGLIHDLGKLLYFFDAKGQWDVVGDTFPIGCGFSKRIIFHEFFKDNPDSYHPIYKTKYGIYSPHCGLDNVMLSWGHDEYMYHIAKLHSTLPKEGLAMIRYHSCYPIHRENGYEHLMNEDDKKMIAAVKAFNPYDLYSKSKDVYKVEELEPYYLGLIDEFFPNKTVEF